MIATGNQINPNLRSWKPMTNYLLGEVISHTIVSYLGTQKYYLKAKTAFTSGSTFEIANFEVVNPFRYLSSSYNQAINSNTNLLPGDGIEFIYQEEVFFNSTNGIVALPDLIKFEGTVIEMPLILDNQYMNIQINLNNNHRDYFERNFRNENVSQKFASIRPLLIDGEAKIKVVVKDPTVNFYDGGSYNNKTHKFRVVSNIIPITFVTAPDTVGSTYVEYNLPNNANDFYVFRIYKDGSITKLVRGPLNTEL